VVVVGVAFVAEDSSYKRHGDVPVQLTLRIRAVVELQGAAVAACNPVEDSSWFAETEEVVK